MTKHIEQDPLEAMFNDPSSKPTSNWFAFENEGDAIVGTLLFPATESEGKFGPQTVYEIETVGSTKEGHKAGDQVKVALKNTSHKVQISQLKAAEVGDRIAFKFKERVDTGKGNPVKSIEVRISKK
jgi:hypothetical protein